MLHAFLMLPLILFIGGVDQVLYVVLLRIHIMPFMVERVKISSSLSVEAQLLPIVLSYPYSGSQTHFVSERFVSVFSILPV
jgi:hypothetical protein